MGKIEYQTDYAFYNSNDQPVYHQCETINNVHRCGGMSMYIVFYVGQLTDRRISKHVCDLCFSHYVERYGLENMINLDKGVK